MLFGEDSFLSDVFEGLLIVGIPAILFVILARGLAKHSPEKPGEPVANGNRARFWKAVIIAFGVAYGIYIVGAMAGFRRFLRADQYAAWACVPPLVFVTIAFLRTSKSDGQA